LLRAFVWYRNLAISKTMTSVIVVVELALAILIVVTAFYGGQLVYEYGVNVSRPAG